MIYCDYCQDFGYKCECSRIKEMEKLERELFETKQRLEEAVNAARTLMCRIEDYGIKEESFVVLMAVEEMNQALAKIRGEKAQEEA